MMTIHEVSKLAGVSVRTLHYYDAIGLLPPTALTESGYRLYDDTALARLQSILLFRELEFPLRTSSAFWMARNSTRHRSHRSDQAAGAAAGAVGTAHHPRP